MFDWYYVCSEREKKGKQDCGVLVRTQRIVMAWLVSCCVVIDGVDVDVMEMALEEGGCLSKKGWTHREVGDLQALSMK